MNKKLLIGCLSLALSPITYALESPINGTYIGMTFGTTYIPPIQDINSSLNSTILSDATLLTITPSIGADFGFQIGRRFNDRYRIETEFLGAYAGLREITFSTSDTTGYNVEGYISTYLSLFLNAYIDLLPSKGDYRATSPYFGIGIGKAYTVLQTELHLNDSYVGNIVKSKESVSVVQAIFGISYFLDDYTSMGIDFRLQKYGQLSYTGQSYYQNALNFTVKTTLE